MVGLHRQSATLSATNAVEHSLTDFHSQVYSSGPSIGKRLRGSDKIQNGDIMTKSGTNSSLWLRFAAHPFTCEGQQFIRAEDSHLAPK
ncbi:unnamed protein product [Sphenostylis stenocarpa]|uniref:Uncharacterized protein n=1 Tax=Sphenostylis stenocarpa TaxID=92480 RepID=A0AA86SIS9_9FABA|nr:unnamed protein product [Sphenostylis stenocarpa]